MFALDDVKSADAGTDVNAGGVCNVGRDFERGHLHGEIRSGQRELNEPAGLLQLFFLEPVQRIEIADFSGDAAIKSGGVKMSDGADTAFASQQIAPDLFGPNAATADQPNACNDNSAAQKKLLLFEMGIASGLLAAFGVLLDVIDGVFYRGNFFGVFVGDLDAEIFLESHHQLDSVERVGAQVVHKRSGRSDFAFIHTELLDNNRFHAFFDAGHSGSSSGIGDRKRPGPHSRQDSAPKTTCPFYAGWNVGSTFWRESAKLYNAIGLSKEQGKLAHVQAAVDVKNLARDVAGFVACEEDDGGGDVAVGAETA